MPLPLGTWDCNINGSVNQMVIQQIDASGWITATIGGGTVAGFWDEVAQKITLYWTGFVMPPLGVPLLIETVLSASRVLVGYLFATPTTPPAGQDINWTITGYFHAGIALGGSSRRDTFGWFAKITQVI